MLGAILLVEHWNVPKGQTSHAFDCAPMNTMPEIAKAQGCKWDPLVNAWLSKEAFEESENLSTVEAFLSQGLWRHYLHQNGSGIVKPEYERLLGAWLTKREHVIHCQLTLRKS